MMKDIRNMMGMTIRLKIVDPQAVKEDLDVVFEYLNFVDEKFSTYKTNSEISQINRREILPKNYSPEMKEVFSLLEKWQKLTNGYFNANHPDGYVDPSGLVKGWAINNSAKLLESRGLKNFYVEAGGDIQVAGKNEDGQAWKIGIKNPFVESENIKIVKLSNQGIATSGSYIRGDHIYNPHNPNKKISKIVSLTVIGPNVYEADCLATAAFAMGELGINFIETLAGFEAYVVDENKIATMTSGFEKYVEQVTSNK